MDHDDGLFLGVAVLCLALCMLRLAQRLTSLEEDADLDKVAAGNLGSLLDAKQAITKRALQRAAERSGA